MSSEAVVQQNTRFEFAGNIGPVFRNNSGACVDQTGRMIRYGLGNDSAKLNKEIKSSDLICVSPTLITPQMVGYYLGVFTALECKPSGWTMTPGDDRAKAQAKFHDIVRAACGFAGFVTDPADIYKITGRR